MRRSAANLKIITQLIRCSSFHLLFSAQMSSFISSNMDSANSQQQRSLPDLPIGALSHVSTYLAPPSRALFAVALNCRDTDSSSAIVGGQQDALDFGDIAKELAAKLTDHDIEAVLFSIDAINNLKTLRLTNLLNITGIGLEPLRGSTMIEKIDLSLVGDHVSPDISPAPPMSCTDVLPILDSIIDMGEESSLKLLIFPKKWRERNINSEFHAFLVRYNEMLQSRVVPCLKCGSNLSDINSMSQVNLNVGRGYEYGAQLVTCYDCMKHYCFNCVEEEDGDYIYCMSTLCGFCNRRYCLHCSRERHCTCCDKRFCVDCMQMKQCAQCDKSVCLSCIAGDENLCHKCTRRNIDAISGPRILSDEAIDDIAYSRLTINWDIMRARRVE